MKYSDEINLFVYGTLIDDQEKRLKGTIPGRMFDCGAGGFPGVIISNQGGRNDMDFSNEYEIHGEIMKISAENLRSFDAYEGYYENDPKISLYVRQEVTIQTQNGNVQCWIYLFNREIADLPEINSGSWKTYQYFRTKNRYWKDLANQPNP